MYYPAGCTLEMAPTAILPGTLHKLEPHKLDSSKRLVRAWPP
jgi:hypothetical protein